MTPLLSAPDLTPGIQALPYFVPGEEPLPAAQANLSNGPLDNCTTALVFVMHMEIDGFLRADRGGHLSKG
jgi:hypothetical protein